jgi:hypothetical protein
MSPEDKCDKQLFGQLTITIAWRASQSFCVPCCLAVWFGLYSNWNILLKVRNLNRVDYKVLIFARLEV